MKNELTTTKILDVQSLKFGTEHDAGYDMFIPKITTNFLKLLLERNENIGIFSMTLVTGEENPENWKELKDTEIISLDINTNDCFDLATLTLRNKILTITSAISIPTGLQILMPDGIWGELCNRSSNFTKNLNIVTGYIDNSFTFGSAFQLHPINPNKPIILETETRIAQIILRPQIKPKNTQHNFQHFENLGSVKQKREIRSGGFGSTGTK